MKNENQAGETGDQGRDHLHELLCKVVFGEASAAETAEVNAALETSEALREQRAELEATVSLVKGALGAAAPSEAASPASAELSPDRMDAVMAAAAATVSPKTVSPKTGPSIAPAPVGNVMGGQAWFRRPVAKAAAAVLILGGVGAIVLGGDDEFDADSYGDNTGVALAGPEDGLGGRAVELESDPSMDLHGGTRLSYTVDGGTAGTFDLELKRAKAGGSGVVAGLPVEAVRGRVAGAPLPDAEGEPMEEPIIEAFEVVDSNESAVDFRGLGSAGLTLDDVTNGLEDMASAGLDNGGTGTTGANAAGMPSSGFFYESGGAPVALDTARTGYVTATDPAAKPALDGGVFVGGKTALPKGGTSDGSGAIPDISKLVLIDELPAVALEFQGSSMAEGAKNSLGATVVAGGAGGGYRGPGDSTPPGGGGGGGGAAAAPAGPASPGPGGPSSPAGRPQAITGGAAGLFSLVPSGVTATPEPNSRGRVATRPAPSAAPGAARAELKLTNRAAEAPTEAPTERPRGVGGGGGTYDNGLFPSEFDAVRALAGRTLTLERFDVRPGAVQVESDDFFLGRGGRASSRTRPSDEFRAIRCKPTRQPGERPRDMFFRFWGDNPYVVTARDAQSTFAADVDTASFGLAKSMLESGVLPSRDQIRTEEFVNAAKPDLAAPAEGSFAIHSELAPSPFGGREDRWLLRVGVRAEEIHKDERPPLALTFVVDTSGSMKEGNRLELVKHAMRLLVDELDARDTISIVRFSNEASEVLAPTSADRSDVIETVLFDLQPDGGTNAEAGLKLGYSLAEQTLLDGVQNRVVFLSDGVANLGQTDQARIAEDIRAQADRGIFLNTIGVGMDNYSDVFLEQLANEGQGKCDYVGDAKSARDAIVERFVGNFVTVAKDVKIQVEFDKGQVLRWRQLGYENRAVADRDFRNDKVDAGEIGAGHQVTCLYELELPSGDQAADAALATVRLRWKPVTFGEAQPVEEAVEMDSVVTYAGSVAPSFRGASNGFRRSVLGAQLAECLRRSYHARGDSVVELAKEVAQLLQEDRHPDTAAVGEMVKAARDLGLEALLPALTPNDPEAAHRDAYYEALIESLGGAEAPTVEADVPTPGSRDGASAPAEAPGKAPAAVPGSPGGTAGGDRVEAIDPGSESGEKESRIRDLLERNRGKEGH